MKTTNAKVDSDTDELPPAFHGRIWRRVECRPGSCRVDDCRSRTGAERRAACRFIATPPLRPRRRAERTGAAGGGERERLVAGGNSEELDRRMPEGRVAGGESAGRGGADGQAVTLCSSSNIVIVQGQQSKGISTYTNMLTKFTFFF